MPSQKSIDLRVREQVVLEANGSVRRDERAATALRAREGPAGVGRDESLEARQAEGVAAQQDLRVYEARLLTDRTSQIVVRHLFWLVSASMIDRVYVRHRKFSLTCELRKTATGVASSM